MSADRPSQRYAESILRKMLEPVLDFLESSDLTKNAEMGDIFEAYNANRIWHCELKVLRKPVQPTLPCFEGAVPTPKRKAAPAMPPFKDAHRKVLAKASRIDRKVAVELIKAAGYHDNSYGWQLITDLTRRGYLHRSADGYVVTDAGEMALQPKAS